MLTSAAGDWLVACRSVNEGKILSEWGEGRISNTNSNQRVPPMVRITRGWQRKGNVISQEPRGMKRQVNFTSSHAVGCGHCRWKHLHSSFPWSFSSPGSWSPWSCLCSVLQLTLSPLWFGQILKVIPLASGLHCSWMGHCLEDNFQAAFPRVISLIPCHGHARLHLLNKSEQRNYTWVFSYNLTFAIPVGVDRRVVGSWQAHVWRSGEVWRWVWVPQRCICLLHKGLVSTILTEIPLHLESSVVLACKAVYSRQPLILGSSTKLFCQIISWVLAPKISLGINYGRMKKKKQNSSPDFWGSGWA